MSSNNYYGRMWRGGLDNVKGISPTTASSAIPDAPMVRACWTALLAQALRWEREFELIAAVRLEERLRRTQAAIAPNLVAAPLTWHLMSRWLQGLAYRIPLSWPPFLAGAGITLMAGLLTVAYQAGALRSSGRPTPRVIPVSTILQRRCALSSIRTFISRIPFRSTRNYKGDHGPGPD